LAVLASAGIGLALGGASRGAPSPARQLVIENPYDATGSWYKGNLQVASARGLGHDLPSAIGAWYAAHGYAFLGISDLNTFTWTTEYGSRSLTALAVVDESYPFGDLLALNEDHWLPASDLASAVGWLRDDNALPVLAAPNAAAKPIAGPTVLGLHRLFGLEVYDARLAAAGQGDATALWDQTLSSGNRVYAFAGDDAMSLEDPALGHAWIEVSAPAADVDSLLSSLRRGAFYASTGAAFTSIAVTGRTITATTTDGTVLRFIGRGGTLLKAASAAAGSYRVTGSEGYVRIEAIRDDGTRAWSQPLFLTWR
jgi:hypothetical protein